MRWFCISACCDVSLPGAWPSCHGGTVDSRQGLPPMGREVSTQSRDGLSNWLRGKIIYLRPKTSGYIAKSCYIQDGDCNHSCCRVTQNSCSVDADMCFVCQVDLITTLTKLSSLGQKINYEAYTYPKQKIDLGKLKLWWIVSWSSLSLGDADTVTKSFICLPKKSDLIWQWHSDIFTRQ